MCVSTYIYIRQDALFTVHCSLCIVHTCVRILILIIKQSLKVYITKVNGPLTAVMLLLHYLLLFKTALEHYLLLFRTMYWHSFFEYGTAIATPNC